MSALQVTTALKAQLLQLSKSALLEPTAVRRVENPLMTASLAQMAALKTVKVARSASCAAKAQRPLLIGVLAFASVLSALGRPPPINAYARLATLCLLLLSLLRLQRRILTACQLLNRPAQATSL